MTEYFDNRPFLKSMPGSENNGVKPSGDIILSLVIMAVGGLILGCAIQYIVNKKRTEFIIKENEELKNGRN